MNQPYEQFLQQPNDTFAQEDNPNQDAFADGNCALLQSSENLMYLLLSVVVVPERFYFSGNKDDEVDDEYGAFMYIEDQKSYLDIFQNSNPYLDRYSDIKPYKHNALKMNNKSKYINASPINIEGKKNLFISTQGPKPETIEDFWTMVYDYNSNVIVMLCKLLEGGRKKCENYWEAKMENFEVGVEKEEKFNMYVIRTLKLKNLEKKDERIVYQIHFIGWPDHGVPDISDGKVFEIFCEINKKVDEFNKGKDPIIVHCSKLMINANLLGLIYLIW